MTRTTRRALVFLAALCLATGAGTAAATPSTTPPAQASAATERSTPAGPDVSTFVLLDAATGKVLSLVELSGGRGPR